jgi:hypothetical protein
MEYFAPLYRIVVRTAVRNVAFLHGILDRSLALSAYKSISFC